MLKQLDKKGQTGGLVTSLVIGIATLIIGVVIAFVIVSTLNTSDLMEENRVTTSVTHENGTGSATVSINTTGYSLATIGTYTTSYVIVEASNVSNDHADGTIAAANYTISAEGVLKNATTHDWDNVTLNYTYDTKTGEEISSLGLGGNLTSGVDNVSSKIPTVLLVAAIVLILGILAVLVAVWQKMRMGGGTTI